jgi:hypothetical protein
MKRAVLACLLFCELQWACVAAETVTLTAGPDVSVSYESTEWKVVSTIHNPDPDATQSTTWKSVLADKGFLEITVASHPEKIDDASFKKRLLDTQSFRGDPAVLVREYRKSIAERDWLVFEMRNPNTRPPRSETSCVLSTNDGHLTIFVVGEASSLPERRESIESFFRQIRVKSP